EHGDGHDGRGAAHGRTSGESGWRTGRRASLAHAPSGALAARPCEVTGRSCARDQGPGMMVAGNVAFPRHSIAPWPSSGKVMMSRPRRTATHRKPPSVPHAEPASVPDGAPWPLWVSILLYAGSGCSALIYELIWFQLLELVIGSSAISLGIVLGVFMGGL